MQPGTDVALYSAMLNHILALGLENQGIHRRANPRFREVRIAVKPYTLDKAAKITGIPAERSGAPPRFTRAGRTPARSGDGLTQHANGTDIVTSFLNMMFACGMIGRGVRRGCRSRPEQRPGRVRRRRHSLRLYRLSTGRRSQSSRALRDDVERPEESLSLKSGLMVTEVVKPESGVPGMYIMGENPVISDPDIAHAEHWFQELEFWRCRTSSLQRPRATPMSSCGHELRREDGHVVNTERRIQLSHQACSPPGEAGVISRSSLISRIG